MNAEESRTAFEKWYFERNVCLPRIYSGDHPLTGQYVRPEARMAWAAWQAAIAATGEDAEKWRALQQSFSRPDMGNGE